MVFFFHFSRTKRINLPNIQFPLRFFIQQDLKRTAESSEQNRDRPVQFPVLHLQNQDQLDNN